MKENKMGYEPIPRLLIQMSLPIALSMLVQALYNIVDSVWVSRIGEDALAAVSMAFPLQLLINALSIGIGVGMNALLSRSLGERNVKKANLTAQTGAFLMLVTSALFAVGGVAVAPSLIGMQTADPEIYADGVSYLRICFLFSFGLFGQIYMERLLQSTGRAVLSMYTQIFGAVLNMVLDPILIFGLGPFSPMGVDGAAIATVSSQISALLLGFYLNVKKNPELELAQPGFHLNADIIKSILAVGIPSAIMMSVNSFSMFLINAMLAVFGSTAIVAYGVYFKVQSFVFMPIFGLNNGMIPVIAYNYGAGYRTRIYEIIRIAYKAATVIMVLGFLAFQFFSPQLIGFFDPSPQLLEIGVTAFRIISFSFIFAGISIISSAVFQSLGNGILSMIVNLIRQLVLIIPLVFVLSRTGVLANVWFAYPAAELFTMGIAIFFMRKIDQAKIRNLEPIEEPEA